MYLTLVIAHTGQGKTTFCKKTIQGKPCLVFDVNNEYEDLSDELNDERSRDTVLDIKGFVGYCSNHVFNKIVVIEDATGFFRGNLSGEFIRMIQRKRHSNNNYILLFHSIASVPRQVYDFANYVILFNTNDKESDVKRKYPQLYPYFLQLQKEARKYNKKIIKLI